MDDWGWILVGVAAVFLLTYVWIRESTKAILHEFDDLERQVNKVLARMAARRLKENDKD
jgi:hypothetical protein